MENWEKFYSLIKKDEMMLSIPDNKNKAFFDIEIYKCIHL